MVYVALQRTTNVSDWRQKHSGQGYVIRRVVCRLREARRGARRTGRGWRATVAPRKRGVCTGDSRTGGVRGLRMGVKGGREGERESWTVLMQRNPPDGDAAAKLRNGTCTSQPAQSRVHGLCPLYVCTSQLRNHVAENPLWLPRWLRSPSYAPTKAGIAVSAPPVLAHFLVPRGLLSTSTSFCMNHETSMAHRHAVGHVALQTTRYDTGSRV